MRSVLAGLRNLVLPWGASPNSPAIIIGPNIPPELAAFYALASETVVGVAPINRLDSNDYTYVALVLSLGVPTSVRGVVTNGGVQEVERYNHFFGGDPTVVLGNFTTVLLQLGTPLSPSDIDVWGSVDIATPMTVRTFQNTASTTASATYAAPTNAVQVDFTAPLSGVVLVHWMARVENNNVAGDTRVVPAIYNGSIASPGAVELAATDVRATQFQQPGIASKQSRVAGFTRVTGLTAGDPYFASIEWRAVGAVGTSTIDDIELVVTPVL